MQLAFPHRGSVWRLAEPGGEGGAAFGDDEHVERAAPAGHDSLEGLGVDVSDPAAVVPEDV